MTPPQSRRPAVGRRAVLVASALGVATILAVLPLCDLLFGCGCDWPWAGGVEHCNIHRANERHCPWCIHPWTANASLAAILAAQALGAWAFASRGSGSVFASLAGGALSGAAAAFLARAFVAWWASYPLSGSG